jgi:hypothetical protein
MAYIVHQHIALNFVVFRAIKYIESKIDCLQKTYIQCIFIAVNLIFLNKKLIIKI